MSLTESLLARRGPVLAALLAAAAALPSLRLPFMSDDWAHLATIAEGVLSRTAFGYFRPVSMATYWVEFRLWGVSPIPFHLTNLILIAAAAALVVILVRRYTGDAYLAGATGLLFALHPYHVENAAWIAARGGPLFSLFFMLAALTYDRWRADPRRLPIAALVLFQMALLSKETAVSLPALLILVGYTDRRRRPNAAEWTWGLVPMIAVALAHFLGLRPWALGESGMDLLGGAGVRWLKNLLGYAAAAVLPAHIEILESRPLLWGGLAVGAAGGLLLVARWRSGRIPPLVWVAIPAFALLVGPSVISFQERFFFLPAAASALVLATLLRASGRPVGGILTVLLVAGWLLSLGGHWIGWTQAGLASRGLIDGLVAASRGEGVREIVVANMPHRVHGAPVAADFASAVAISGGRPVAVRFGADLDYPTWRDDALDGSLHEAIRPLPTGVEISLRVPEGRHSRCVRPVRDPETATVRGEVATVVFDGADGIRVRVLRAPERGREAYLWSGGRLVPLFTLAQERSPR